VTRVLAVAAVLCWAAFSLLWLRQRATRNATAVDAAWAVGIGLMTAALAWASPGNAARRGALALLVNLWAFRLGGHLFFDRVMKGIEDSRYARFRQEWSQPFWYGFYMVQAALVFLLPLTFLAAFRNPHPFPAVGDVAGAALWALCLAGESVADRQLARFRADPINKGKTCRSGLWRYSRHPNYFFEWLLWMSYVPLSWGAPTFLVSFAGPVLLLVFLTKVSGIPPTEAQALLTRGDDYRAYQRETSAFFPWFSRRGQ
jgi:steroid 5-alpha reductase family enzyme